MVPFGLGGLGPRIPKIHWEDPLPDHQKFWRPCPWEFSGSKSIKVTTEKKGEFTAEEEEEVEEEKEEDLRNKQGSNDNIIMLQLCSLIWELVMSVANSLWSTRVLDVLLATSYSIGRLCLSKIRSAWRQ